MLSIFEIFCRFLIRKARGYLSADLVAALASLDVHDFTHLVDVFREVSHQLEITEFASSSLRPLVWPSHRPAVIWPPAVSVRSNATFVFVRENVERHLFFLQ